MDETDVALCRLLIYNSRMPYSELGKVLGISVQSAHRRVQDLISSGVIAKFPAAFSGRAYRSTWVLVHGRSEANSVNDVLDELGRDKEMDMAMVASGNYLYVGARFWTPDGSTASPPMSRRPPDCSNPRSAWSIILH